jgi:hypothetical protein
VKARMGRPPLADGKAREIVFTIRLAEAERDQVAEAARRAGRPASAWARDVLLAASRAES